VSGYVKRMLAKPTSLSAHIDTIAGARKKIGTISNVNVRKVSTAMAEKSQKVKPRKIARQTKRYLLVGEFNIRDKSERAKYQIPAVVLNLDFVGTRMRHTTLGLLTYSGRTARLFEESVELLRLEEVHHE